MGRFGTISFWAVMLTVTLVTAASAGDIFVPDDYATIGEAMASADSGDTVYVRAGRYNERVAIKEGVRLISFAGSDGNDLVDGPGAKKVLRRAKRTIIDGTGIKSPGYLVSFPKDTTASMTLDGFTIVNMPKYRSGINLFLVEIRGCSPRFLNNIVGGNRSWGGVLSTGLGIAMGPPLETVAKPLIQNNVVYDNVGAGISNGPNSAATVIDNEIFDNRFPGAGEKEDDAPGIGVREYARPLIERNVCYRNGSGIGVIDMKSHAQPLIIKDNLVYNNRRAGIAMKGIGSVTSNVKAIIKGNKIYGNLKAGIRLSKLDYAEIIGNAVFDNTQSGAFLVNVDKVVVIDNEIRGNWTAGIRLLNVPSSIVKHNRIYDNLTAGIDFIGWKSDTRE